MLYAVIVDTCVWSLLLRRNTQPNHVYLDTLKNLLITKNAVMLGAIKQEVLSGIKNVQQFEMVRSRLSVIPDVPLTTETYETAALFFNHCRSHGIQGSHIDFLICAAAYLNQYPILTMDKDFTHYQKYIDFELVQT